MRSSTSGGGLEEGLGEGLGEGLDEGLGSSTLYQVDIEL